VRLLVLGDRDPRHLTHREIDGTLPLMPGGTRWTATDSPGARALEGADGVWLVSGGPYRDDANAYAAIEHCLESGTPFLGTCSGFQYACVQLTRTRGGIPNAEHAEADPDADELVIVPLQCKLYGERRMVTPVAGTQLAAICGTEPFEGFHFCGYGLDERFALMLEHFGVVLSASAPDAGIEGLELPEHPFFIATAFQPQVGVPSEGRLHPLLDAFVRAAAARATGHEAHATPI
jgi:CTP synthase (UTP-ammonia lyase)